MSEKINLLIRKNNKIDDKLSLKLPEIFKIEDFSDIIWWENKSEDFSFFARKILEECNIYVGNDIVLNSYEWFFKYIEVLGDNPLRRKYCLLLPYIKSPGDLYCKKIYYKDNYFLIASSRSYEDLCDHKVRCFFLYFPKDNCFYRSFVEINDTITLTVDIKDNLSDRTKYLDVNIYVNKHRQRVIKNTIRMSSVDNPVYLYRKKMIEILDKENILEFLNTEFNNNNDIFLEDFHNVKFEDTVYYDYIELLKKGKRKRFNNEIVKLYTALPVNITTVEFVTKKIFSEIKNNNLDIEDNVLEKIIDVLMLFKTNSLCKFNDIVKFMNNFSRETKINFYIKFFKYFKEIFEDDISGIKVNFVFDFVLRKIERKLSKSFVNHILFMLAFK